MKFGEFGLVGGGVGSSGPVRGRPFAGEWEERQTLRATGQTLRAWGMTYRDGKGRTRTDLAVKPASAGAREPGLSVLSDPTTLKILGIEAGNGRLIQFNPLGSAAGSGAHPRPVVGGRAQPDSSPTRRGDAESVPGAAAAHGGEATPASAPDVRCLGRRLIDGTGCVGTRDNYATGTLEQWVSEELLTVVLFARYEDPEVEIVYRIFNLRLAEPDPTIFEALDG